MVWKAHKIYFLKALKFFNFNLKLPSNYFKMCILSLVPLCHWAPHYVSVVSCLFFVNYNHKLIIFRHLSSSKEYRNALKMSALKNHFHPVPQRAMKARARIERKYHSIPCIIQQSAQPASSSRFSYVTPARYTAFVYIYTQHATRSLFILLCRHRHHNNIPT